MLSNPETLPPQLMFSYDTKKNIPWNIQEYKTPRLYLDPAKQARDREYLSLRRTEKVKRHETKRGFFMDY